MDTLTLLFLISVIINFVFFMYTSEKVSKIKGYDHFFEKRVNPENFPEHRIEKLVEKEISKRVNNLIESSYNYALDQIDRKFDEVKNQAVDERVSVLCKELAEKYTFEHFENQLKDSFSNKLADDIKSNLLGYKVY